MSNPVNQLPRTALAATTWTDTNRRAQIRVYFQEKSGAIRESQYDTGTWKLGPVIATDARLNTPIATTSWVGDDTHIRIRVYYLSPQNTLREMCCDPGPGPNFWGPGSLNNSNVPANPASQLSVVRWLQEGKSRINLYYQNNDNFVQEYRYVDARWFTETTLNKGLTGTSISAILFNPDSTSAGFRVYYQDPQLNLLESAWYYPGRWTTGSFRKAGPGYTPLAAITWGSTPEIRVYTTTNDANVVEYQYSGSDWLGPRLITHSNPGSFLAAISLTSDAPNLRVYYIEDSNQIKEMVWAGSNPSSWGPGSTVPTGDLQ